MKVVLLKRFRGEKAGSVHEVSEKAAKYLIADRTAELYKEPKKRTRVKK